MAPSVTPASTHYALVIDAGSSGSRLQIYSWRDPDLERAEIINEVQSVAPRIQATLSAEHASESRPWVESSKAAQGRTWWWPEFLRVGKGKGKERGYEVAELERRALRRLVRVGKGVEGDEWVKRVEPGISSVSPSDIPEYLAPLLSHALQHIPPSQHAHTPIYLYATAGMRLLPESDQTAILSATCDLVRKQYPFKVGHPSELGPCGENIRIISGEEEGMWGWVAVNYLMDGFGHAPPYDGTPVPSSSLLPLAPLADAPPDSLSASVTPVDVKHHSPTFGFLDMGGASTQLAFSPTALEIQRSGFPEEELRRVALRLLSGEEVEWPVFVASWLGFGTNQARERYIESLLDGWRGSASAGDTSNPIRDPCLPLDLTMATSLDGSTPELIGTGEFGKCLTRLKPLLDHAHPCPTNHCLFGGQPTPHIDFAREDQRGFIGVSEYWYTAHQVLGLGGVWDWGEWEKGMNEFCATDWSSVESQLDSDQEWHGSQMDIGRLQMQCFKGAWISNVLHEGIGIPRLIDSGGKETLTGELGGTNAEAERRAREKGLLEQEQKGKKYFQSMDEVDSTAISWTLGKMVIEASKAVPPRSTSVENAWRARLPLLGLGGVGKAMQEIGIEAVYVYAIFGAIVLTILYNWVKGRKKFPLSSPGSRGRGRKPSISDGPLSPGKPARWFFAFSSDEDEESAPGIPSSGSSSIGSGNSRNRATIGRVRLWSLRIANTVRRSLPFHRSASYDNLSLPRTSISGGTSRPSISTSSRSLRHASMPLHGLASSTMYSPGGYASQPPSPRAGHSSFFGMGGNGGNGSSSSSTPGHGNGASGGNSVNGGGSASGSGSFHPSSDGVALTVPIARPGSTTPEARRVGGSSADLPSMSMGLSGSSYSHLTSPPRGTASVRPARMRQNSNNSGVGFGSSQGNGNGGSAGGWNDPPVSMLSHSHSQPSLGKRDGSGGQSSGTASAGTGAGNNANVGGAGVLTPSAGGISRQSSRVNLSDLGLKERSSSRMGNAAD